MVLYYHAQFTIETDYRKNWNSNRYKQENKEIVYPFRCAYTIVDRRIEPKG
jgi:hypothetical protein